MIHIADEATSWHPHNNGHNNYSPHNVVVEEFQNSVDVNVLNNVPESFHNVLHGLFTPSFFTVAMYAGRSISQYFHWFCRLARGIVRWPATSLASVHLCVTHARDLASGFTVRHTLSTTTLALVKTRCVISLWQGRRTFGRSSSAVSLFLACVLLGFTTQGSVLGVVAIPAAGRVSITALGVLLEPALVVAARVAVLASNKTGITLLSLFHQRIATERLLWL